MKLTPVRWLTTVSTRWVTTCTEPFYQFRSDPACALGLFSGLATFVVLQLLMAAWVHHAFEGKYHAAFLASERLGVTSTEADAGYTPSVSDLYAHNGWDGQFFFRVSIDPFGLDQESPAHLDIPGYRYQRIGVPILAWAASHVLGYEVTSPYVYHTVQMVLVSLGFAVLVFWLKRQGVNPLYALAWLGAGGTLYTLGYGLPDSSADALFIVCLCAIWYRWLATYVIAATLLLLIREGYAAFAAVVFLFTASRLMSWSEGRRYGRVALLTALPGLVVVGWYLYVSYRFGIPPLDESRHPPGFVDYPFAACWDWLKLQFENPQLHEMRNKVVSALTIALALLTLLRNARRSLIAWCVAPYIWLVACLGSVVWWDQSGYFKALGSVLVVLIFMLPLQKGLLIRLVLAANLLIGLDWNFVHGLMPAPFHSTRAAPILVNGPYPTHPFNSNMNQVQARVQPLPGQPTNAPLPEFSWAVKWLDARSEVKASYQGIWRPVHRELVPLRLAVTNRSNVPWQPNPQVGWGAVNVAYLVTDALGNRVFQDGRIPLPNRVEPGETIEVTLWLRLDKPRENHLALAVVQEGVHGTDLRGNRSSGVRYAFHVR